MADTLDVQRDHVALLSSTAELLAPEGVLIFSTNAARFKLDSDALSEEFAIRDISRQTIPKDYERNARIHRCWHIAKRSER
jgi:23S rRNA (guanine2445-N2)-methyltransferase / 23S rRNA (guanine2069-N7)-methyltransferase